MLCTNPLGADNEVVIKWRDALETKETGLICELMAALLAQDLDLPVPKPFIVEVPPNFVIREGKSGPRPPCIPSQNEELL
jgi:hypothetical protein